MVNKDIAERLRGLFKIRFGSDYFIRIHYYTKDKNNNAIAFQSKNLMKVLMYISNNFEHVLSYCVKTQAGLILYRHVENNLKLPDSYAFPLLKMAYFRVSSDNSVRIGRRIMAKVKNGTETQLAHKIQEKYYNNALNIKTLRKAQPNT